MKNEVQLDLSFIIFHSSTLPITPGPDENGNLTELACRLVWDKKATTEALFYTLNKTASQGSKLEEQLDLGHQKKKNI